MSDSQSERPRNPNVSSSGVLLLVLNGILIAAVLWLFEPLIKLALADSVLERNGLDFNDPRTLWAGSLLVFSLVALFGLWRCYRPTQGWSVVTLLCLFGLVIHGFAGMNLKTNSPTSGMVVLGIIRIALGSLLALDLFKHLNADTPKREG